MTKFAVRAFVAVGGIVFLGGLGIVDAGMAPRLTGTVAVGPNFGFNYSVDISFDQRLDPAASSGITCPGSGSAEVQCAPAGTFFTIYDIPGFVSANVTAPGWSVTNQLVGKTPSSINGSFDNATLTNITFSYTGAVISGPVTISGFQIVSTFFGVAAAGAFSSQDTRNQTDADGETVQGVGFVEIPAMPPTIQKAFGAPTVALGATTTLSFTITNPNSDTAFTGVAFSDTLPAGLIVSSPNLLTGSCGGGTITAVTGSSSISLSGATIAAGGNCAFSVGVVGTTAGTKNNLTNAVSSNEGGTGGTASASIVVAAPPTIQKAFGVASIRVGDSTSLGFTITNPNTTPLTGVGFSDTLPAGLVVSSPNGLTNTCGGTVTAVAGSGSISLSGGAVAAGGNCTLAVNVTGTTVGTKSNTTGTVTSTEGGTGSTSNTATITVTPGPPTIQKAFGVPTIPFNGSTSLTFTIGNPNTTALTGVGFGDTLPAGLVVSSPNGLTNTCGGTVTAVAGSGSISLSGGTIAASGSCALAVNVTGTTAGTENNTTGNVTSSEGGMGGTASASIEVEPLVAVPTLGPGALVTLLLLLAAVGWFAIRNAIQ